MGLSTFRYSSAILALLGVLSVGAREGHAAAVDPSGDLEHVRPLLEQTLETEKSGIEIRWSNPDTSHTGKIRVERTFFRDGQPCRDYLRTVERASRSGFVIRGTACRTGRAVWSIEDEVAVETDPPRSSAGRQPAPTAGSRTSPSQARGTEGERDEARAAPPEAEPASPERTEAGDAGPEAERADEPFVSFTLPSRSPL